MKRVDPERLLGSYSFEYGGKEETAELKIYKIIYSALVAHEPTKVFRENRDHELGMLTHDSEIQNDIDFSRKKIAEINPFFRDTKDAIAINIHSGMANNTSSQGCQNVSPKMYRTFFNEIRQLKQVNGGEECYETDHCSDCGCALPPAILAPCGRDYDIRYDDSKWPVEPCFEAAERPKQKTYRRYEFPDWNKMTFAKTACDRPKHRAVPMISTSCARKWRRKNAQARSERIPGVSYDYDPMGE